MRYVARVCRALAAVLLVVGLLGCASFEEELPTGSLAEGSLAEASLHEGQLQFNEGNYGKAVAAFMETVEKEANNAEAWLGLAASYDQIRRFDLADKAYARVVALAGETAVVLNNIGYSYYLRGDLPTARRKLAAAEALSPGNPRIANNIALVEGKIAPQATPVALLAPAN